MPSYWVYILASKRNGTLYVGVSNNLARRIYEHKHQLIEGFSKRYRVDKLVYAEEFCNINDAISREKRIKSWNRAWKLRLIEELNPTWDDLYQNII